MEIVKIVVTIPESHADIVRKAAEDAGAGRVGLYTNCSFSVKGVGRFVPSEGSKAFIGEVGKSEEVLEERVEWTCERELVPHVMQAIRDAHPYEEPAIDVYRLEDV